MAEWRAWHLSLFRPFQIAGWGRDELRTLFCGGCRHHSATYRSLRDDGSRTRQRVVDGRLLRIRPFPRSLPAPRSGGPEVEHQYPGAWHLYLSDLPVPNGLFSGLGVLAPGVAFTRTKLGKSRRVPPWRSQVRCNLGWAAQAFALRIQVYDFSCSSLPGEHPGSVKSYDENCHDNY